MGSAAASGCKSPSDRASVLAGGWYGFGIHSMPDGEKFKPEQHRKHGCGGQSLNETTSEDRSSNPQAVSAPAQVRGHSRVLKINISDASTACPSSEGPNGRHDIDEFD